MSNHEQNPVSPDVTYDALLIVSYGGPEGPEEVRPFLENVLRGRGVSQQQLEAAAAKYNAIGGASPVNEECRSLIGGLLRDIDAKPWSPDAVAEPSVDEIFNQVNKLPVYWGNLFWYPLLEDTIAGMAEDGIRRVIAFCTVPFDTEHSRRSYGGAIDAAVKKANTPSGTPVNQHIVVQQTRLFYNHPLFISTMADRLAETLQRRGVSGEGRAMGDEAVSESSPLASHASSLVLFTAHSVPQTDAAIESYLAQLKQACSLVAELMQFEQVGITWDIAFQSRGSSQNLWCGPSVADFVTAMPERFPDKKTVIACPIGFMLENMELLFDLDIELRQLCESLGLNYERTLPVSGHRKTIAMIRELVAEVYSPLVPRRCMG